MWLYITRETDLFDGRQKTMLHIAPELFLARRLRPRLGPGYITADLDSSRAMMEMDITDIQYPDESFNIIYCSHVLEHVSDDRKAMREFYRVLKTDGWVVLSVPITVEKTIEDPKISDPEERMRLFGQWDHVRAYGQDFSDRLRKEGFQVQVIGASDFLKSDEIKRMRITGHSDEIFRCSK